MTATFPPRLRADATAPSWETTGCSLDPVPPGIAPDRAAHLARGYRALADPTRLLLLATLAAHDGGTACVCDLSVPLDLSQPTISHHLKVLRDAGLVTSERRGTWVHYHLEREALAELMPLDALTPTR